MGAYGRDRVEDLLDACHAVALHQPQAQLIRKAPQPEPQQRERPWDVLFPDEVASERERVAAKRDALRKRFPREPEEDLLAFIERHARGLDDWQRDVISIVRSEQSYFFPQMRTKILNEGTAVYFHQEICQRLFLPTDRYWEFEQLNAVVTQPHSAAVNPYNLGVNILREVMRIAGEPDDEERDRWA
jgi:stage V sporulation protein R